MLGLARPWPCLQWQGHAAATASAARPLLLLPAGPPPPPPQLGLACCTESDAPHITHHSSTAHTGEAGGRPQAAGARGAGGGECPATGPDRGFAGSLSSAACARPGALGRGLAAGLAATAQARLRRPCAVMPLKAAGKLRAGKACLQPWRAAERLAGGCAARLAWAHLCSLPGWREVEALLWRNEGQRPKRIPDGVLAHPGREGLSQPA